jgi:hypothetical protein
MKKPKACKVNLARHRSKCDICKNPQLKDIELDYTHCIPFRTIESRYHIVDTSLMRHAAAVGLDTKRDRKNFYWRLIEGADFSKMTVENALEAAKQLDRIEHKVDVAQMPSNIQVVYSGFGRPIGNATGPVDDNNRLPAATDPTPIPPQRKKV